MLTTKGYELKQEGREGEYAQEVNQLYKLVNQISEYIGELRVSTLGADFIFLGAVCHLQNMPSLFVSKIYLLVKNLKISESSGPRVLIGLCHREVELISRIIRT